MDELVAQALAGDRRAIGRLITTMESGGLPARQALAGLYPHTGRAHIVGVTGPPGSGKSTLVTEIVKCYRRKGLAVGVVAVDPTSPFSGGALLGDRIRMREVATDPHVFIRSMATRGSLGGLARATVEAVHVLDAAGYPLILVETVGAGQSEVDIARTAHTVIVVQMPSSGDDIQASKAGILEIADILVVNKADLPGADNAVATLQAMLDQYESRTEFHHGQLMRTTAVAREGDAAGRTWRPPVLKTCALSGEGAEEVVATVEAHRQHQAETGSHRQRERERAQDGLLRILRQELVERLLKRVTARAVDETVNRIVAREVDPYSGAEQLMVEAGLKA